MTAGGIASVFVFLIFGPPFILFLIWICVERSGGAERRQLQAIELEHRAEARGWRYSGVRMGDTLYRMFGTTPEGQEWVLEYHLDHSGSTPDPKLHFKVPGLAVQRLEWRIAGASGRLLRSAAPVRAVIGAALRLSEAVGMDAEGKRSFFDEACDLGAHTALFRRSHVLLGRKREQSALLDAKLESLIVGWPWMPHAGRLRAEHSVDGLVLVMRCEDPGIALMEHMVRIGSCLAARASRLDLLWVNQAIARRLKAG
jgi:hypothetical protein